VYQSAKESQGKLKEAMGRSLDAAERPEDLKKQLRRRIRTPARRNEFRMRKSSAVVAT
jgi:hypothetical protein